MTILLSQLFNTVSEKYVVCGIVFYRFTAEIDDTKFESSVDLRKELLCAVLKIE